MNQTFNLNRFLMLFKKHVIENYKTYLMSVGVLAGILFLWLGLSAYFNDGFLPIGSQMGCFVAGLLLGGCIFTSLIFADLGNKKEAISALTLPASVLEKYLVSWIVSFLIFTVIFTGVFYAVAATVIGLGHNSSGKENVLLNVFSDDQKAYYGFIIYIVLHAVVFLGAIYFEKLHFIKTAFAFFTGAFLLSLINRPILSAMFNQRIIGTSIFSPVNISNGKEAFQIHAPDVKTQTEAIITGVVVLVLWISAYYKLKEKEV
ncbi:MAG: hypothetical protein EOP42_09320 [Sphingobacteriaceae bacterium]|nr:MAG: hypothetical protein EOP42_09320 [Sphingobacteriaceae bacterium]